MYILQIKQQNEQSWIAAVFQDLEEGKKYQLTLDEELQEFANILEIQLETYPFYIVENLQEDHASEKYFEFLSLEDLVLKIKNTQKTENDDYIYFNHYYLEEDYFQFMTSGNYMAHLRHTCVMNCDLDENEYPTVYRELIEKTVDRYDIDGLDQLFEQAKDKSEKERHELALLGYDKLFWEMNYDYACSKLTETGIYCLVPMVKNMEILLDKTLWEHRAYAYGTELEESFKNNRLTNDKLLNLTVESFEKHAEVQTEDGPDIFMKIARTYTNLLSRPSKDSYIYWSKAMKIVLDAIENDPFTADWGFYFELIFDPLNKKNKEEEEEKEDFTNVIDQIRQEQAVAVNNFHDFLESHHQKNNLAIQFVNGFKDLKRHNEWRDLNESSFPNEEYLYWLNQCTEYNPESTTRMELMEIANFFHNEGNRLQRLDLLEQSIRLYTRIIDKIDDPAFELYYVASIWKDIHHFHLNNNNQNLADEALQHALDTLESNLDIITANFSTHSHYAEFLEYCLAYRGNIEKPSFDKLDSIYQSVEDQGEGHYGTPFFLRMRLALLLEKEDDAIYHLTKALICHELCHDKEIDDLVEKHKDLPYKKFYDFVKETKVFMDKAQENYYLDTELKWKKLKVMSKTEVKEYWESRKEVILNREKIDFGDK